VPKDPERAAKWYRAAAEQGYGPAQGSLALAYYWGTGVARDHVKAAHWYRRAAEHDLAGAGYMLGLIYWSGEGVAKDIALAAHWHGQAAEHGNHYAQQFLARLYRDGRGVARDKVQAYKWLDLAIPGLKPSPARDSWIEMREQLGETMTAEEIAEARRLAREWTPKVR
jgi:TPR repeat protein